MVNQSVAVTGSAFFRAQYSADGRASWSDCESGGSSADLLVGAGTGLKVSGWGTLVGGAAADVQLGIVGQSGDGATDPAFRHIAIEFR